MKYEKIEIFYKDFPRRLYRVLLVRSDLKLEELGCVLACAIGATLEHVFVFTKKDKEYVPISFMDDPLDGEILMDDYSLSDLGDYFNFEYDLGEGWSFGVEILEDLILNDERMAIVLEGEGQGIWEDNRYSLDLYLSNKIEDDTHEVESKGIYFPWNFKIKKFSDFDKKLNINKININFDNECKKYISEYFKSKNDYLSSDY